LPESGKKFAMPTVTTMTKLAPTAAGRTKFMLYCLPLGRVRNIQHGKDGNGRHWFYASWGEIAEALGWHRDNREGRSAGTAEGRTAGNQGRHQRHGYEANDMRVRFGPV